MREGYSTAINAILDWPMCTQAGIDAFLDPRVNAAILRILSVWSEFLSSPASAYVLNRDPRSGWFGRDAAAAMPQRRAQIQELAARAKRELTAALGQEGAEAYVQRSPWLSMLAGGLAFSTIPPATGPAAAVNAGLQGIYPVMPAGATSASATRQMVFSSESTITSDAPGGVVREAVRVMTFPTGEPSPGTITTPGQTTTIIVTLLSFSGFFSAHSMNALKWPGLLRPG